MEIREPKPMKEIHLIREKIYYETKGKNINEIIKYIKEAATKFEKTLYKKESTSVK